LVKIIKNKCKDLKKKKTLLKNNKKITKKIIV